MNAHNNHDRITFAQAAEYWLNEQSKRIKVSTYVKYRGCTDLLSKSMNTDDISSVTSAEVEALFSTFYYISANGRNYERSQSSIYSLYFVLSSVFKYCEKMEWISENPVSSAGIKIRKNRKEIDILNKDEQLTLENYLLKNPNPSTMGILLCMYTGLRIGEICALKWCDIDMSRKLLNVNRTVQRIAYSKTDGERNAGSTRLLFGKPKSESSRRVIPIPKRVVEQIGQYYAGDGFVLADDAHTIIEPRTYQYRFSSYLASANVRKVNFHVLRHTFATRCIESGMDIKALSELLGHTSVKITMDNYVHPTLESKRSQLENMAYSI